MSTITYKCPNCDADLSFRPGTGDFSCQYCGSSFSEEQLNELLQQQNIIDEQQEQTSAEGDAVVYTCPSCGAEVITDTTTAASFCFYCHNPVIMKGRLTGEWAPDKVIPFTIPKEDVKERLIKWCREKKYIDDGFFSDMQLEKLSGVYFPFWLSEGQANASVAARTQSLRVWRVGDIEYTETSVFQLDRSGVMDYDDITIKALSREDAELLNGVYPYDMSGLKPFDMKYLSGFLAEKRDIEKQDAMPEAQNIIKAAAEEHLDNTLSGHGMVVNRDTKVSERSSIWKYALMPAWMLTYRYNGELYYFAMNGQTGKIAGRVPVSDKKLNRLFGIIVGVGLVLGVIGGLMIL